MWQGVCDSVQGSVTSAPSLPDIRCIILSSSIWAGLSCQETWQIVSLDKTFASTANCVSVCVCICVLVLLTAGVGVYPQQEHIQTMLPAWVYNDSLVPGKRLLSKTSSLMFRRRYSTSLCVLRKEMTRIAKMFCFSFPRNVQEGSWNHHDSGRDRHSQTLPDINVIRSSQGSTRANLGISQPHNTWHADQGGTLHCTCTNWGGAGNHWSQNKLST